MNEYLIRVRNPENVYDSGDYHCLVKVEEGVLNILHTENPVKEGDELIGQWNAQGQPVVQVDQAAYEEIRPLGNEPSKELTDEDGNPIAATRGGDATEHLLYHHFAGWRQRQLGTPDQTGDAPLYPEGNAPLAIETRNKYFEGAWAGHGWRAEIIGAAVARDPSVRAIAWYSDPECTQYVATTGAFQQGPSDWQVDDEGNPLTVWFSETPPGFAKPSPEPWYLAVLWGSVQEGYATLEPGGAIKRLYWAHTRPKKTRQVESRAKGRGKARRR